MARLLAAGIALAISGTVAGAADAQALEDLRWSKRVVLVLTPTVDDPRARALRDTLARRACEFEERNVVLLQIPTDGPASLAGRPLSPGEASRIREDFYDGSPFQVLLLGKDGGVKLREDRVPDLDAMFALIDGMPMRRAEMRALAAACPGRR